MVFLFVLLSLAIIVILFINAKIKIDIKEIEYASKENMDKQENNRINIKIKFIILGFIPIFWQTINNKKIEEAKQNKKLQERYQKLFTKLKGKNMVKVSTAQAIKIIKNNIDIKIKKFYLNLSFAIDDAVATSILVPIISTILAILFYKKNVKPKKQKYKITPMYNSRKFNKNIIFRYI